ncbi:hypothetical protein [Tannockella kyphosi]|uniref:hypothetical protein n=1 Tax=Tannockella kyphosi TaxID=2899121 RepID=UPI00201391F4|nr:hypothetical protein [Tannockella kyphosi]
MEFEMILIAIVFVIALFIGLKVFKNGVSNKKTTEISFQDFNFDMDTFLNALGSLNNITGCEATNSKVSIILKDETDVDIEKLKSVGASGIVCTGNKVMIILGQVSKTVATYINERLSR